ncbi:hypothetical protein [Herbiconiux sp. VKM Ac-2851]|jgi:hypothetical protein|uniref:hypothetical protein n=1 Tax=Herbiconiux sp. VKM Ac-2851 TaxID=2739025 RepID=UPI0015658812|nr:hypothetical protein [Herbiconiux sp. VKM Ac-2851]NQX36624.1 hypothetical protein [Herbiconiux sp. VKM Ac-2851]
MVQSFTLIDAASLGDLKVYLGRAARVEPGSARLLGSLGVLAVYTPTLTPKGLLDRAPTVLGLRTFALNSPEPFDTVVPIRSLLDRLAQLSVMSNAAEGPLEVPLPPGEQGVAWAGISPPRGGWEAAGAVPGELLEAATREGVAEVAAAVPDNTGEQLVHKVRSEVWGRDLDVLPELEPRIPAGAAFSAVSLGFVRPDDAVSVYRSGSWLRLTTRRGHVLVRR